jgi:DNA-binding NarL/FixJ family response regulator
MNAAISGRAGTALLLDGESLLSFDVDDPATLVPRSPSDLPFLFGAADDLRTLENVDHRTVAEALEREHNYACALDLALIMLDSDLSDAVREEAAVALERLIAEDDVLEHLENILYAHPLPVLADADGALRFGKMHGLERVFPMMKALMQRQPEIRRVHHAWEAIPARAFAGVEERRKSLQKCIAEGFFRYFVNGYSSKLEGAGLLSGLLRGARFGRKPIGLGILQCWVKKMAHAKLRTEPEAIRGSELRSRRGARHRAPKSDNQKEGMVADTIYGRSPGRERSNRRPVRRGLHREGLYREGLYREGPSQPSAGSSVQSGAQAESGFSALVSAGVLIADDSTLVRAGMRATLERIPYLHVVAEAGDGREALQMVQEYHPDVVLMAITLPAMNGIEATARIAREFPSVRVVIHSTHTGEEYVWQAFRAGASGYLPKAASPQELDEAIKSVLRGKIYVSRLLSRQVTDFDRLRRSELSLLEKLTPRQREILQLIAEGKSTKGIAKDLEISVKTVETHLAQLMDRIGIHGVGGLVRFALRSGLIKIN